LKSLIGLIQQVIHEMGDWCHASTANDVKTIVRRVESEGVSFLTISLANFGKDFEKSLDQGFVAHDQFVGFRRRGGLPLFLGGFLELVFNPVTGVLVDVPSVDAIHAVRQITLMFSKVAIECSPERTRAALQKYIDCEQEVKDNDAMQDEAFFEDFDRMVVKLWSQVFSDVDRDIYEGNIVPKHGPGATAERTKGNRKYDRKVWTERLEKEFPAGEFLTSSYSHYLSVYDQLDFLEPGAEPPVRVITVPKTLKTPRIIAIEPTHMQYVQQGILESFLKALRADDSVRDLVDNSSQVPNQDMAREGSVTGALATLDLSEASDRVSNQHVRRLFRNFPHLQRAVDACRSRKADVPGFGVIRLAKFASMGSALCFPMEFVVFATVVFIGIEKSLGHQMTKKEISSYIGRVRIYGDDIIVPVEHASSVVSYLELFGYKVNGSKSFWTGKFRESCGKEYYDGHDVSIVRVRELLPSQRKHSTEIISTVDSRNQFYKAGFWATSSYLDELLTRYIPFPRVGEDSPALGRYSFLGYDTHGIDKNLHRPFVKAMVVSVKLPSSELEGYGALMKGFLKRSDLPFADRNHLLRAGRPVSVDIKHRRVVPF